MAEADSRCANKNLALGQPTYPVGAHVFTHVFLCYHTCLLVVLTSLLHIAPA